MTKSAGEVAFEPLEMMPVRRMIAVLHRHYPKQFKAMFLGDEGSVAAFWDSLRGHDPRLQAYRDKLAEHPDHKTKFVPMALRGDAVPVTRGAKSMHIVSATSLFARGSSVNQKLLIACYWSHLLATSKRDPGQDTEANVWKLIL
jgi:hypothetical protein